MDQVVSIFRSLFSLSPYCKDLAATVVVRVRHAAALLGRWGVRYIRAHVCWPAACVSNIVSVYACVSGVVCVLGVVCVSSVSSVLCMRVWFSATPATILGINNGVHLIPKTSMHYEGSSSPAYPRVSFGPIAVVRMKLIMCLHRRQGTSIVGMYIWATYRVKTLVQ